MNKDNNTFKETVEKNRKESLKKIVEKMNDEKLRVLQKFLDESNILYDPKINDYYKLISNLKKNLSKEQFEIIENKCKEINDCFEQLINDLSTKSTTAFNKFVDNLEKIIKPISIGLALNTALKLAPTPVTKLTVGAVSILYTGYNIVKNNKYKKVITRENKLNEKLQDLEFSYDEKGNLIDTRFSKVEQEIIRTKLKEMNVQFIDAGYQTLRNVVYGLDYDKKLKIVMVLSGIIDKKKIEKELEKYGKKPFFNKKAFLPVSITASSALLVGLDSILNGIIVNSVVENITDNSVLSKISGSIASLLTLTNKNSPLIQAETLFLGSVIAIITKSVGNIVYSIKKKSDNNKLQVIFEEIENSKYKEDILEEQNKLKEILVNSKATEYLGQLAIIEIVTDYMRNNLQIKITSQPKNIYELYVILKGLNKSQRNKVNKLMKEFDYFNDKPNNQFKRKVEKFLKATGMTAILGLAGMSVVDIFTGGEFLKDLRDKLFFYDSSIGNYNIETINLSDSENRDATQGIYFEEQVQIFKAPEEEKAINCYVNTLLYESEKFGLGDLKKHGLTPETYKQYKYEISNLTLNDCNRLVAEGGIIPAMINSSSNAKTKDALEVALNYFTERKKYLDKLFQLDTVGSVVVGIGAASHIKNRFDEEKVNKK